MTRSMMLVAVLLAFGVATAGCGGDSGGDGGGDGTGAGSENNNNNNTAGSSGGGNSRTGVTSCGDFPDGAAKSCQAGQYCLDQITSQCGDGCLSDTNCASNQTCEKAAGQNVGSCQNVAVVADCGPVCDRVLACDKSVTRDMCLQFCAGFNEECKECILGANCNEPETCDAACGN